jgi:hypothetical protein
MTKTPLSMVGKITIKVILLMKKQLTVRINAFLFWVISRMLFLCVKFVLLLSKFSNNIFIRHKPGASGLTFGGGSLTADKHN